MYNNVKKIITTFPQYRSIEEPITNKRKATKSIVTKKNYNENESITLY